ncbi:MAG: UvrD-helicase domain-containing protein [Burkholderiales bacterium]
MSDGLNPPQHDAVRYTGGPCLVLAGAGSGKTRVIIHKIAHLIHQKGIAANAIAAVTFTNKAAAEMKARTESLIGKKASEGLIVSTFHSLGVRILRAEAKRLGLRSTFSIFDAEDCFGILQGLLATTDKASLRRAQSAISLWKNGMLSPEEAIAHAQDDNAAQIARLYRDYSATLRAYQAVDFDDLIRLPAELFNRDQEARESWQAKFAYLLVDEYQDTNACQYALLRLLTGDRGAFTLVGDDDQSIYGWRGATLDNLGNLQRDYPELKIVKLEQNYRSSQRILHAANTLIAKNPKLFEKRLWSDLGIGDEVVVTATDDDDAESERVVMRLLAHRMERKTKYSDYAILYRSNQQARIFEQMLRRERVPYVLSGGQSFFERAEIRDLIAYLRVLVNGDDDPAFIRAATTPKRGIGPQTLEALGKLSGELHISLFEAAYREEANGRLAARALETVRQFGDSLNRLEWRAKREPAGVVLDDLIKAIGYEQYLHDNNDERTAGNKWQNVLDFRNWISGRAEEDDKTLLELAQTIALITSLDKTRDEDAVQLSTLHASKGLEFPHVFLVGVEEGYLPHLGRDTTEDGDIAPGRIEEERRLMYVGVTRAQRSLYLTWCRKRKRAKEAEPREPSRFIAEMGLDAQPAKSPTGPAPEAKERMANLKAMLQKASR